MSGDETKPTRGRPKTIDADHVLGVAVAAYWREDPADVSVNALCQMAGVSKPSLYREFGSEDGLMCAALNRYADEVLRDVFAILSRGESLDDTLAALTRYALDDPRMEKGCLFYKMRAGKHRLGPQTRARVGAIAAAAQEAYETFLQSRLDAGDWSGEPSVAASAGYLGAQLELAVTQRAAGEDPERIRASLALAFSVFTRP